MSNPMNLLTTQEFAEKAGVSAATVSKWLHNGKIIGEKKGRKWSIAATELTKVTPSENKPKTLSTASAAPSRPQPPANKIVGKSFSIQEFADMTYLTEWGVRLWLKQGRLDGVVDVQGNARVDGANLEKPHVKRLVR